MFEQLCLTELQYSGILLTVFVWFFAYFCSFLHS